MPEQGYIIVKGGGVDDLVWRVEQMQKKGYRPIGGITIVTWHGQPKGGGPEADYMDVYQPMVRE